MLCIELLAKHHHKANFDCGNDELNRYLVQYANQHAKKGISKTYVLVDDNSPNEILGFYSLSANALRNARLGGYPNMDLPCILLGRLAIASRCKGQGLTSYLMASIFDLCKRLAGEVGITVILVDLKHLGLVPFYQRYGFVQIAPNDLTMLLKVQDIA